VSLIPVDLLDSSLVGKRVALTLATCNQVEESQLRVVEGVVLYVSKDRVSIETEKGVEVVERGLVVAARILNT